MAIPNDDLRKILLNAIVIRTAPTGEKYLGLICQSHEAAFSLMNILKYNAFKISIDSDVDSEGKKMTVDFPELTDEIFLRFSKTPRVLKELEDGDIQFISTGFVDEKGKPLCFSCIIDLN